MFSYRYDAFGSTVSCLAYSGAQATEMNEPDASNPFLFSSKRFGFDTQLSYFGARYYDASLGRFISRDPMRYIDGPNQYIYCANNPMRYIDPTGLAKCGSNFLEKLGRAAVYAAERLINYSSFGLYDFFTEKPDLITPKAVKLQNNNAIPIHTNGIFGSRQAAQKVADTLGAYVVYNPSKGAFSDIMQSFWQKTIGRFAAGGLARGHADFVKQLSGNGTKPVMLIGHSQGTITLTQSLEILHREGFSLHSDSSARFLAPATLKSRIEDITKEMIPATSGVKRDSWIYSRPNDFIPETQSTLNPIRHLNGWLHLPMIGKEHNFNQYLLDAQKAGKL